MSEETLAVLLAQKNVLWCIYDNWLAKDDSNYSEMEMHITDELESMVTRNAEEKAA